MIYAFWCKLKVLKDCFKKNTFFKNYGELQTYTKIKTV